MTDEEKRSEEEKEAAQGEESTEASSEESGSGEAAAVEKTDAAAEEQSEEAPAEGAASEETEEEAADTQESPEIAAAADHGHSDHGHGDHGHGDHDHGPHIAPMSLLIGVFVALTLLTILTVAVTMVDLGSSANFVIAMIIATVKACLVMGYFMHMFWDSRFNVVAFTSSFLFVILFLAMALLDRAEYQFDMDVYEVDKKAQAG